MRIEKQIQIAKNKEKKKNRQIEWLYQQAVVDYLKYNYPKVKFTISPSGNKLSWFVAKKFKMMAKTASHTASNYYQYQWILCFKSWTSGTGPLIAY